MTPETLPFPVLSVARLAVGGAPLGATAFTLGAALRPTVPRTTELIPEALLNPVLPEALPNPGFPPATPTVEDAPAGATAFSSTPRATELVPKAAPNPVVPTWLPTERLKGGGDTLGTTAFTLGAT